MDDENSLFLHEFYGGYWANKNTPKQNYQECRQKKIMGLFSQKKLWEQNYYKPTIEFIVTVNLQEKYDRSTI